MSIAADTLGLGLPPTDRLVAMYHNNESALDFCEWAILARNPGGEYLAYFVAGSHWAFRFTRGGAAKAADWLQLKACNDFYRGVHRLTIAEVFEWLERWIKTANAFGDSPYCHRQCHLCWSELLLLAEGYPHAGQFPNVERFLNSGSTSRDCVSQKTHMIDDEAQSEPEHFNWGADLDTPFALDFAAAVPALTGTNMATYYQRDGQYPSWLAKYRRWLFPRTSGK